MASATPAAPTELGVDYASPPGALLESILRVQGLSQSDLADRTGLSTKYVNQLIKHHVTLSAETAVRLEAVTGVAAELWSRLEADYRAAEARAERQAAADQWLEWLDHFRLAELKSRGVIPSATPNSDTVVALLQFFGISSPEAWDRVWRPSLTRFRQSPSFRPEIAPTTIWLRIGQRKATKIDTKPYDPGALVDLLPRLRRLTRAEPDAALADLPDECASAGVAVVYASELDGCRASGATWWARPDKAVILLSNRGKREDRFWFSLFHGIGHLLKHAKRDTYLDQSGPESDKPPWDVAAPTSGFIDDGSRDSSIEREADAFASSTLIPEVDVPRVLAVRTELDVHTLADHLDIAPGVVAGRWQFELKNYTKFNGLRRPLPSQPFTQLD